MGSLSSIHCKGIGCCAEREEEGNLVLVRTHAATCISSCCLTQQAMSLVRGFFFVFT